MREGLHELEYLRLLSGDNLPEVLRLGAYGAGGLS